MTEKRFHYDYKTGRMKDTQSNSQATKDMRVLETIINDACYFYEKKIKELEQENKIHLREGMWLLRFLKVKGFTEDDVIKFKEHMQKQNRGDDNNGKS